MNEIRAWRRNRNLTLQQLADRSGVAMSVIQRHETGGGEMKASSLAAVVEALGDIDTARRIRAYL